MAGYMTADVEVDSLFHDPDVQAACEALFALIADRMAARGDVFWNAAICVAGRDDGHYCEFGDQTPAAQEALAGVLGALLGDVLDSRDDADCTCDPDGAGMVH
jgi:hypothetical protein